jgi:hypothetical protein
LRPGITRRRLCASVLIIPKKNGLDRSSPWKGGHDWTLSSMAGHGELTGEGREGGGRRAEDGGAAASCGGEGADAMGGLHGEGLGPAVLILLCAFLLLLREQEEEKREKRKRRNGKERKRKGEIENAKIFQT